MAKNPKEERPKAEVMCESPWKIIRREVFSAVIIALFIWAGNTLTQIQLNMASLVKDVAYLVKKIDSVETETIEQRTLLVNHEKRLIFLETMQERSAENGQTSDHVPR